MKNPLDYVKYDSHAEALQAGFKTQVGDAIQSVVKLLQPGRAKSLAITKLEEAYMWIGKAIRDEQLEGRDPNSPLQEERKDG